VSLFFLSKYVSGIGKGFLAVNNAELRELQNLNPFLLFKLTEEWEGQRRA